MDYPMRIGGEPAASTHPLEVRLPYDGTAVGTIFEAGRELVDAAVKAAVEAGGAMREMILDERAAILRKAHDRLIGRKEEFATAISSESGKPLKEARLEVDRAALTLLFSSEEAHRLRGEVVPMDASPGGRGHMAMTVREPVGVVAAITPFNFPLNLAVHKIGPALAGGNTVIHKPASATPISAILMADLFTACGLPKGALNVITGPGGSIAVFTRMWR